MSPYSHTNCLANLHSTEPKEVAVVLDFLLLGHHRALWNSFFGKKSAWVLRHTTGSTIGNFVFEGRSWIVTS